MNLAGRSQFVSIDGCDSPTLPVLSGVPQGSVLGPLLFVSYINDVAAAVSSGSNVNMFTDDIALYRVIKTRDDYVYLQEDGCGTMASKQKGKIFLPCQHAGVFFPSSISVIDYKPTKRYVVKGRVWALNRIGH